MRRKSRAAALTADQAKLAAENHNLIYGFLNASGLPVSEYYGVAAFGLCRAAQAYDPERGAFSSFAYRVMRNSVLMEMRDNRRSVRAAQSLDEPLADGLMIADTLYAKEDTEDEAVALADFGAASERLSPAQRELMRLLSAGMTQKQIAARLGVSQCQVSRLAKQLRQRFN